MQTDQPKLKSPRNILGIFGEFCSGKETLVNYLKNKYSYEGFNYCNFNPEFKSKRVDIFEKPTYASIELKDIINDMTKINICLFPLISHADLLQLLSKSSFQLIFVTSPSRNRFENYKKKYGNQKTFDDFLNADYEESSNPFISFIKSKARFIVNNNSASIEEFYEKIDKLIINVKQYRPNWDDYFMGIAHEVEQRCNCAKSKIGAVITKDNRIISVGYNGTSQKIANCYEGECVRCWSNLKSGQDLDKCICIHAEENALLEAGRKKCIGAKVYTTVYPCLTCSKNIIQCGITEVVYDANYDSEMTKKLFETAGVKIIKWKPAIDHFL